MSWTQLKASPKSHDSQIPQHLTRTTKLHNYNHTPTSTTMALVKMVPSDLTDKVFVITGANSGLGLELTKTLTRKGAHVIMACRSEKRATKALEEVKGVVADAKVTYLNFDQSSFESIKEFIEALKGTVDKVDCLINNAGLGGARSYDTKDGLEFVTGVNHFGCFAVTIGMLNSGLLANADAPRVVITSSELHRKRFVGNVKKTLDGLDSNNGKFTGKGNSYNISKLFNLLMALKLKESLDATGSNVKVIATHPGLTVTHLNRHIPPVRLLGMNVKKGALGSLVAATVEELESGSYVGPGSCFNINGYPVVLGPSEDATNKEFQDQLWKTSEDVTGVKLSL